jgi:hypothetical protein|tara:strand:- start:273 stop:434 length:162 start_codon:yes stop_codon:yes gene_type:complete
LVHISHKENLFHQDKSNRFANFAFCVKKLFESGEMALKSMDEKLYFLKGIFAR